MGVATGQPLCHGGRISGLHISPSIFAEGADADTVGCRLAVAVAVEEEEDAAGTEEGADGNAPSQRKGCIPSSRRDARIFLPTDLSPAPQCKKKKTEVPPGSSLTQTDIVGSLMTITKKPSHQV